MSSLYIVNTYGQGLRQDRDICQHMTCRLDDKTKIPLVKLPCPGLLNSSVGLRSLLQQGKLIIKTSGGGQSAGSMILLHIHMG